MSDNRTTELLPCPFCGGEASKRLFYGARYGVYCDECDARVGGLFLTEAEAIAAWNARAERGTLTAEQVRETVEKHWHDLSADYDMPEATALPEYSYDWQAIADELNAELGGGNCARCAEDMGRYADSLCDPLKERIAELLRCLENDWHIHASWDGLRKFWCIELTEEGVRMRDAAHAERTCEIESSYLNDFTVKNMCWYEFEMKCGYRFTWDEMEPPKFCPNCGGAVKVVDA